MNNQENITDQEEEQRKRQEKTMSLGKEIHQKTEDLMLDIESFIDITEEDLSLVIYDLKRLANFLDAVIEAHPITFTLFEVMEKVHLNEPTLRQLLVDVGVDLDKSAQNPDETVTEKDLIALLADRAGSREGDLLADFLRGDSPKYVNC